MGGRGTFLPVARLLSGNTCVWNVNYIYLLELCICGLIFALLARCLEPQVFGMCFICLNYCVFWGTFAFTFRECELYLFA